MEFLLEVKAIVTIFPVYINWILCKIKIYFVQFPVTDLGLR